MSDLKGLRVIVAGAGAVGSVAALGLARLGADVTLADPVEPGRNASGVAAGMLAPAAEALLDPKSDGHYALLRAGRDGWAGVLEGLGEAPPLDRSGALLQVRDDAADALLARAAAAGAALERVDAAGARGRAPGLAVEGPFLFTPDDWRLEPQPMLEALHRALLAAGGLRLGVVATGIDGGQVRLADGGALAADVLILATGSGGGGLTPVKGQILRFPGLGPASGPVVRAEGVYAAPSVLGMVVGATMEEGRDDLGIDSEVVERLSAAAARLFPELAQGRPAAFAGVRAATADGLPIVGPASHAGVLVARGARRNGWLLAPLMAQVLSDHLLGREPSVAARAFDPARFG